MEQATPLRPIDQRAPELSDGALELQQYLDESERTFQRAMDSLNGLNAQPDPSTELDEVRCSETLRELLALKVKAQKLAITAKAHQIATAPASVSDGQASASLDGSQKTETQTLIESAIGENSKRMLIAARVMSDKDGYFGNLHKEVIVQASDLPVSTAEDRIEDPIERTEAIAKTLVTEGSVVGSGAQEKVRVDFHLSAETLKLIIDNIVLFSDAATARAIEAKKLLDAEREREIAEVEEAAAQQSDGPEEISLDLETIQEVTDAIEGRMQSYRDRAIEVLSRKRTRVVETLNATLGMQSVINELKVKGMKHGVSPDLISIPLSSLTSGEINENIIFQMQERSRNIVDEIARCEKEIVLSDPSKWEHSVNKYNTAEAWKARFGKAKPIEATAQATGLHDRAERRSREAREEVRLALSAVAEFGGGPEQVGPEDAMEQLQNSPVLLARIRHIHEDAQKRKGELENQKKELEVMLVYVEKCVERARELKRALDGYDSRLDALTNENSPTGPLRLRLQELESAQSENWDLDAMIEVCSQLRDMYSDAGETHDEKMMAQRIRIIEGLRAERSRTQSAAPPNPPNVTPMAAAGASGQPPEGGGGSPTAEATPRVERTKKYYEHTMKVTLPVTGPIEEVFTGLVVDGKQAVIRVDSIPNGRSLADIEISSPAISLSFTPGNPVQQLLLDRVIEVGLAVSSTQMYISPEISLTPHEDYIYRWGVRRLNGKGGEALTGTELKLQIWCDVETVKQTNVTAETDDGNPQQAAVARTALNGAIQASTDSVDLIAAVGAQLMEEESESSGGSVASATGGANSPYVSERNAGVTSVAAEDEPFTEDSPDLPQQYEVAVSKAAKMTRGTPVDEINALIETFKHLQSENLFSTKSLTDHLGQALEEDCYLCISHLEELRDHRGVGGAEPTVDTSHIPFSIKLQLDRVVKRIPENLRTKFAPAIYKLYDLEGVVVEGELKLVEKASEIAHESDIPIFRHAAPAFAEFIQAVFTRYSTRGLISTESKIKVRESLGKMISEDAAAVVDLMMVLAGGVEGNLLKSFLTAEGTLDKSSIAGLVVKLIAQKMGANAGGSPVVESLGKATEGLCTNSETWRYLIEILQGTEGFDTLVASLKERFAGITTA